MNIKNKKRFFLLSILILVAALSRLLTHPPNFAPIGAIALFGGAYFSNRKLAFIIPMLCLLFSDALLHLVYMTGASPFPGFHGFMPFVYLSFILVVIVGMAIKQKRNLLTIFGGAIGASIVFFFLSNLGVWLMGTTFTKSWEGLVACYAAAIPFFHNTLAGNLFFSLVLFGAFEGIKRLKPSMDIA